MPRNRIIYQSQAVGLKVGAGAPFVINGVQSVNYGTEIAREDVYQYGKLAASDRVILEAPTVSSEVSMYYPNGSLIDSHFRDLLAGSIKGESSNELIIALDKEAEDVKATADLTTVTVGSANMSSFNFEASVGAIPTLTLGFEGTNLTYGPAAAPFNVADEVIDVNNILSTNIIPFTGVVLSFSDALMTFYTNSQSATLSFDLGFEALQRLGNADGLSYARVATLPASATLDVEAIAIDKAMSVVFGSLLAQKASAGGSSLSSGGRADVTLTMGARAFKLQKATLDSTNYTSSLGDNASCSASFGVSISTASTSATESTLIFS